MQALYDFTVHTLMAGFLDQDVDVISQIPPENLHESTWLFTLPQLFTLALDLYAQHNAAFAINPAWPDAYTEFRRLLYKHPTNTMLLTLGGTVTIYIAHNEHDKTIYCLQRQDNIMKIYSADLFSR